MFFKDYTTVEERACGMVDVDVLITRYRAKPEKFFRGETVANGDIVVSIAVDDKIYELTIELSCIPTEDDGIYLMEMDFDAETREMGNGVAHYLPAGLVPLTWQAFIATICEKFELSPAHVWGTGLDVLAYWPTLLYGELYKVPSEADRAKYSIASRQPPAH